MTAYRTRGTHEWLRGHSGKAGDRWRKSFDLADKLGARYEGACTRLEIGRRLDDRAQLDEAEAEFAEMGAASSLAETPEILGKAAGKPMEVDRVS